MGDAALTEAYNAAVDALRRFCDAYHCIVALYIVGPSHRGAPTSATSLTHRAQVTTAATDNVAASSVRQGAR
jgi:hypothetical protein